MADEVWLQKRVAVKLQVVNCLEELQIGGFSNFDVQRFVDIPETEKLAVIQFGSGALKKSDLLLLKAEFINLSDVSIELSDVLKFIKQWLNGERDVVRLRIVPMRRAFRVIYKSFKKDVCVHWTPETHEDSPYAHIEEQPKISCNHEVKMICSMTRDDGQMLSVVLGENAMTVRVFESFENIEDLWTRL